MYFPYLRGRQYELIALRELLDNGVLSSRVIPVVEPVKLSSTLINTLSKFEEKRHSIAVITNPSVGTFAREYDTQLHLKEKMEDLFELSEYLLFAELVTANKKANFYSSTVPEKQIAICKNPDDLEAYRTEFDDTDIAYTFIPNSRRFNSVVSTDKVKIENKFEKRDRNSDYLEREDEFFSEEHLYYSDEGCVGFSDYTIVGEEYSESGFAPYAVAIHIVYIAPDRSFRVRHFVSDSNLGISNPAGKFSEALTKMMRWLEGENIPETYAIQQLKRLYETQTYPGLGVVKKLSIMHHLELVSKFLDGELG